MLVPRNWGTLAALAHSRTEGDDERNQIPPLEEGKALTKLHVKENNFQGCGGQEEPPSSAWGYRKPLPGLQYFVCFCNSLPALQKPSHQITL